VGQKSADLTYASNKAIAAGEKFKAPLGLAF
jgi:hypothetical protein